MSEVFRSGVGEGEESGVRGRGKKINKQTKLYYHQQLL